MASRSTQPDEEADESIPIPAMTLQGHKLVTHTFLDGKQADLCDVYMAYFPDGEKMISGSDDKTARRWDLQAGKEIEEAREVREQGVRAVAVSRDGRWVGIGGDPDINGGSELKACQIETGIVKIFEGHSERISCIDISADSTLLASGSWDRTVRIWNLDTGKLVAGPFETVQGVGAVRFSQDSKKLAIQDTLGGYYLEVWDVQTQKLDVRIGDTVNDVFFDVPVFWTTKDKTIVAAFSVKDETKDHLKTIYEFDASTLETVGAPFEGHTRTISGLALSFDCALLASASFDHTIKLWAFESRQLLASFYLLSPNFLVFSPNSRRLAVTTLYDPNIYIHDIPPDVITRIWPTQETSAPHNSRIVDILNSDATRRPVRRNSALSHVISPVPHPRRPLPTRHSRKPAFFRYFLNLLPSSRTNAPPPVRNDQPRSYLNSPYSSLLRLPPNHFPLVQVTSKAPSDLDPHKNPRSVPAPATTQSSAAPTTFRARIYRLLTWWHIRLGHPPPPVVDVPLAWGELRHAAAGVPPTDDDDLIRDEDYVPPPSPYPNSQPLPAGKITAGEHGRGILANFTCRLWHAFLSTLTFGKLH